MPTPSTEMLIVAGGAFVMLLIQEPMNAVVWVLLNAFNMIDSAWQLPALFLFLFWTAIYHKFFRVTGVQL